MFKALTREYVDVGEVTLRARHAGHEQPVVPLHGHPRTHTTRVAPQLAGSRFVVRPDLRGATGPRYPPTRPSTPSPPSGRWPTLGDRRRGKLEIGEEQVHRR